MQKVKEQQEGKEQNRGTLRIFMEAAKCQQATLHFTFTVQKHLCLIITCPNYLYILEGDTRGKKTLHTKNYQYIVPCSSSFYTARNIFQYQITPLQKDKTLIAFSCLKYFGTCWLQRLGLYISRIGWDAFVIFFGCKYLLNTSDLDATKILKISNTLSGPFMDFFDPVIAMNAGRILESLVIHPGYWNHIRIRSRMSVMNQSLRAHCLLL